MKAGLSHDVVLVGTPDLEDRGCFLFLNNL